jgi:hypothetical protein
MRNMFYQFVFGFCICSIKFKQNSVTWSWGDSVQIITTEIISVPVQILSCVFSKEIESSNEEMKLRLTVNEDRITMSPIMKMPDTHKLIAMNTLV